MPPWRSACVAAAAEHASSALSPLPPALVLHVFSLLPADVLARAACVCRGWRATLLERSLWSRLDLTRSSGVRVHVTDAVLASAAAKARGALAALNVTECGNVTFDALLGVVRANGGALRELCAGTLDDSLQTLDADRLERLLQAAPQLAACHARVYGISTVPEARRMLRNEPPFQPLRVHALFISFDDADDDDEAVVLELAAAVATHASLTRVELYNAPLHTPAALEAVVGAALACGVESIHFAACHVPPAGAPALVRLLGGGTLTKLAITNQAEALLDGAAAALLGAALRANSTLTSLALCARLWHNTNASAALLAALAGHRSLRTLKVSDNQAQGVRTAAGAAFGALIAANAPALTELDVSFCRLGDAGLRPLFAALPANTHLRTLDVAQNGVSQACARDVLLPAVRANASLWLLIAHRPGDENAFTRQAEALVLARGAAMVAGE
jgi:hypothetical protein